MTRFESGRAHCQEDNGMEYILSPKDTTEKIPLPGAEFVWQEGRCFVVRFKDGTERSYPMDHIWYIQKEGL